MNWLRRKIQSWVVVVKHKNIIYMFFIAFISILVCRIRISSRVSILSSSKIIFEYPKNFSNVSKKRTWNLTSHSKFAHQNWCKCNKKHIHFVSSSDCIQKNFINAKLIAFTQMLVRRFWIWKNILKRFRNKVLKFNFKIATTLLNLHYEEHAKQR